jgi:hypothetical protein
VRSVLHSTAFPLPVEDIFKVVAGLPGEGMVLKMSKMGWRMEWVTNVLDEERI